MYIYIYILYTKSATKLLHFLDICKFIFIFFRFLRCFLFFLRIFNGSITYQLRINHVSITYPTPPYIYYVYIP